jgi:putative glycerol-1-phosphate prenyltransferase
VSLCVFHAASRSDKIVWENLDHLILKIKQSPATHIFIGGSLVETNIIDELIIRLKHKVKLWYFSKSIADFSRSRCHFVSFPDIRKKSDYLIYQVKLHPFETNPT